jgi:hypothetical protein
VDSEASGQAHCSVLSENILEQRGQCEEAMSTRSQQGHSNRHGECLRVDAMLSRREHEERLSGERLESDVPGERTARSVWCVSVIDDMM